MSCTFATLAACFSMAGFYVETDISWQDARVERTTIETHETRYLGSFGGVRTSGSSLETKRAFDQSASNPYGLLALGYDIQPTPALTIGAKAFHDSSLADDGDRGINGAALYVVWRPFAR